MFPILVLCTTLVALVSCNTDTDLYQIYNEFAEEVIQIKEIEKAIRAYLPMAGNDTDGADGGFDPALYFLDASTKIPSGILGGNFFDLGHFDECYKIQIDDIYGKYCLGTVPLGAMPQKYVKAFVLNAPVNRPRFQIHPEPRLMQLGTEYVGFHWAACVPSNMSAKDIPGLSSYSEDLCYSKATEPALSAGAIVTIVILAVFLAIAAVSTAYDVYLYYTEKTTPHELLIAFSFLTNGRKIFKSTSNPDQLLCLNGIKALSMMWVILGHEYSNAMNAPLYNFLDVNDWERDPANMFVMGATVSVDTFFVVGGLVTVYTFLKSMNRGVKFNVILFYVHRYLRLTPALGIAALFYVFLLNYMGNGPVWVTLDKTLGETCREGWWSTFLYISNYVKKGTCLPQAWYLSVDMQLFVLSPVVLIPLFRWPKPTLGGLGFLAIVGCVVPFAIGYSENLGAIMGGGGGGNGGDGDDPNQNAFMDDYYIQTYTRFGPYVIGMILGYFVYKLKSKQLTVKIPKLFACLLWLIFVTGLVACVYAGYPLSVATEEDKWGNSLHLAFDRPAWSVALSGVIFLCVSGYGQPIDWFLSLPIFQFLTKISYSMYLVHFAVITMRYAAMKNTIKFSNIETLHVFWADFMVTLGLSLVLCLMFESPIIILEKYLFGNGPPKKAKNEEKKPEV